MTKAKVRDAEVDEAAALLFPGSFLSDILSKAEAYDHSSEAPDKGSQSTTELRQRRLRQIAVDLFDFILRCYVEADYWSCTGIIKR